MPVVFITDALIFLLLFMVCLFIWYTLKHEYLRIPWRQVGKNSLAMSAAVVLLFYIAVGLLDTIHFHPRLNNIDQKEIKYSTDILSLLDVLTEKLRSRVERTYSAPFATHAYAKEAIDLPEGRQIRDYPRLYYGGSHLQYPGKEIAQDILGKTITGMVMGIITWLFISMVIIIILSRIRRCSMTTEFKLIIRRQHLIPWHVILITLGCILISGVTLAYLSSYYHVLGTDKVGQDVLYQSLKSVRTGLLIGTLTTLVMLPFALAMGIMAGYFSGWVDDIIQYIYTTLNSIPGVLLIAAAILMLEVYMTNHAADFTSIEQRADMRLLFLCMILGIMSWTGLCRLLRGETLKLREIDYVQAAQAFGVNHVTIMTRHVLPNVMHIVMISIVLDFSGLVLVEAVLAYISIGVDPSMISWGNMINSARLEMAREPIVWWSLGAAFIFMLGLVLAANLFADAVRDAFDPRIRTIPAG
ncbi:MAG: ABC transporter permease [Gammaproteobacteria bacterium]|nr:ABC transporter permease [Gammaproteobacteria bacterium]